MALSGCWRRPGRNSDEDGHGSCGRRMLGSSRCFYPNDAQRNEAFDPTTPRFPWLYQLLGVKSTIKNERKNGVLLLDDSTTTHAWTDHPPKRKLGGLDNKEYPLQPHLFSLLEGRHSYLQRFRHAKHRQGRISADTQCVFHGEGMAQVARKNKSAMDQLLIIMLNPTRLSRSASVRPSETL
jgi:hypothetical protein